MFLHSNNREKDGKDHRYFRVLENQRVAFAKRCSEPFSISARSTHVAWRKTLSVFDEQQQEYENLCLFPDDREIPANAVDTLQVKLSGLELRSPPMFGSCWLACELRRNVAVV